MDKMTSINIERLKHARNYYGLSIEEVASKSKIEAEKIKEFEDGFDFPSYAQFVKIANTYKRNLLYFFFSGTPSREITEVAFRNANISSNKIVSIKVKEMIEKAYIYRLNLIELYDGEVRDSFNTYLTEDHINDVELFSYWLRDKMEFDFAKQKSFATANEVIEYLREKLYKLGVFVFKDSFRDDEVSGICLYDEMYPVILINNKTSHNRQLFTIFHELYHIYNKQTDIFFDFDEEKECDKFAGEFLIPTEELLLEIGKHQNIQDVAIIKEIAKNYNVSVDALLYRLYNLNKISKPFYISQIQDSFIRQKNGSGGNFYFTKASYLGKAYLENVFHRYYSGKLSVSQVAYMTQLKPANVSKLASNIFGGIF